jgi:diketogulonate reductase-like aldo/keto reductase
VVKEAMANGRLGPRGTGSHRQVVDAIAERHGIGPDAVALAAVLAQQWADVVLSGAVYEAELRSNLEAPDVEPSDADFAELGALTEAPDLYWERRYRSRGRQRSARGGVAHASLRPSERAVDTRGRWER